MLLFGRLSAMRAWAIAAALLPLWAGAALPKKPPPRLIITFNPQMPSLLQTSPPGTVVSTVTAAWSNGMPFTGTIAFGYPNYDDGGTFALSGSNIIVSPVGPGLNGDGGSVQHVTLVASQSPDQALSNLPIQVTAAATGGGMPPPAGYTSAQLIFEDEFTAASLDTTKWNPWMGTDNFGRWGNRGTLPSPYSAENCQASPRVCGTGIYYNVIYYDPYPYGYSTNTTGDHLVGGNGNLALIANPQNTFSNLGYSWAGAAVTSYGHAYLPATGGYVQWRAKMPDSRYGAWAVLWMLDTNAGNEIDMQESGSGTNLSIVNNILAMNVHTGNNGQTHIDTGVDLSAAYHVYGLKYVPGTSITFYLDGAQMAEYKSNIPNVQYEIIMEFEFAGSNTSGFHTVADPVNHPGPFEFDVNDVQIYHN
jgi:hypothetical protein